ncbi:MAG TPA: YHS domain-containing protein [Verrucomicrobiae bacterium]|nr:YHS domain-containing protein [Verrucomicrobiae bacterium]
MRRFALHLTELVAFAALVSAGEVIHVDKNGIALQGYDPVAYFTDGKPVRGSPEFTATYKGATYQFVSAEHKQLFEKSPAKYELWHKDVEGNLKKADSNWPTLSQQNAP